MTPISRNEVSKEDDAVVFTLRQIGITKKGKDEMYMNMSAQICQAYIELQGAQIRQSELDEGEALVQFRLPK